MIVTSRSLLACYLLLFVAYAGGALVPLMNNDSAHHAGIALHIHLSGDWFSLVTQGEAYKDKPHLLFWLAALSFKLFGVNTLAYKLPSLLASLLAVHATMRLGSLLYSAAAGRLAGLLLAAALSFALANNDVRMDALLTAGIVFATWQLAEFVVHGRWRHLLAGGAGLAAGLATKGMIGVAMPLIAIFLYLLGQRAWSRLFDWRWLLLPGIVLACAAPVLLAYYQQFGSEGIRFILWSQNFERLAGERFGNAGADDPWFFFHTFIWAFLPWSLLTAWALLATLNARLRARLRADSGEMLTLGIILVMFAIISASRFKLPHYLNILLPFFAILLAGWLVPHLEQGGGRRLLWIVQGSSIAILAAIAGALNLWAFPAGIGVWLVAALLSLLVIALVRQEPAAGQAIVASAGAAAVFLFLLNFNFYPQLLTYQAGSQLGSALRARGIPPEQVVYLEGMGRAGSFDFTVGQLTPVVNLEQLKQRQAPTVVYTSARGREAIAAAGIPASVLAENPDFRVTRLNPRFLDPTRRATTVTPYYLLQIGP